MIEHIFGVLKQRFRILRLAPAYKYPIQARVPAAACAIHNFISCHDPIEGNLPGDIDLEVEEAREANAADISDAPALEVASEASKARHDARRDRIATAMWNQYQGILRERGPSE